MARDADQARARFLRHALRAKTRGGRAARDARTAVRGARRAKRHRRRQPRRGGCRARRRETAARLRARFSAGPRARLAARGLSQRRASRLMKPPRALYKRARAGLWRARVADVAAARLAVDMLRAPPRGACRGGGVRVMAPATISLSLSRGATTGDGQAAERGAPRVDAPRVARARLRERAREATRLEPRRAADEPRGGGGAAGVESLPRIFRAPPRVFVAKAASGAPARWSPRRSAPGAFRAARPRGRGAAALREARIFAGLAARRARRTVAWSLAAWRLAAAASRRETRLLAKAARRSARGTLASAFAAWTTRARRGAQETRVGENLQTVVEAGPRVGVRDVVRRERVRAPREGFHHQNRRAVVETGARLGVRRVARAPRRAVRKHAARTLRLERLSRARVSARVASAALGAWLDAAAAQKARRVASTKSQSDGLRRRAETSSRRGARWRWVPSARAPSHRASRRVARRGARRPRWRLGASGAVSRRRSNGALRVSLPGPKAGWLLRRGAPGVWRLRARARRGRRRGRPRLALRAARPGGGARRARSRRSGRARARRCTLATPPRRSRGST